MLVCVSKGDRPRVVIAPDQGVATLLSAARDLQDRYASPLHHDLRPTVLPRPLDPPGPLTRLGGDEGCRRRREDARSLFVGVCRL